MKTISPQAHAHRTTRYLVCVDAHDESRVALKLACLKARARGNAVGMLHVLAPGDFQTLGAVADRMREERYKEGEELLTKLAADATASYGVTPHLLLREGSTGDEIIAATHDDTSINIIVIGVAQQSASRGKLTAWLVSQFGSKLFIPLLLVPGNLTEQQLQNLV